MSKYCFSVKRIVKLKRNTKTLKNWTYFFKNYDFVFDAIEAVLVMALRVECIISPLAGLSIERIKLSRREEIFFFISDVLFLANTTRLVLKKAVS